MATFILLDKNSVADQFMAELREVGIQNDRLKFRLNLQRLGQILAYEISKTLTYEVREIQTPLGIKNVAKMEKNPVLLTILRAGLPFFQGFLDYFDQSDAGFVGAYRMEDTRNEIKIKTDYIAAPPLSEQNLIVIDPMLATGSSMIDAIKRLYEQHGEPQNLHIACVIASKFGLKNVEKHFPNAHIWACAVDDDLNEASYIVPRLGDAGDLSFGQKM